MYSKGIVYCQQMRIMLMKPYTDSVFYKRSKKGIVMFGQENLRKKAIHDDDLSDPQLPYERL